jgi:hypothetical protein
MEPPTGMIKSDLSNVENWAMEWPFRAGDPAFFCCGHVFRGER